MSLRSESSSRPARWLIGKCGATVSDHFSDQASRWPRGLVAGALGVLLFSLSFVLLHLGFWGEAQIVDTPVYERYGRLIVDGAVPYRDFAVEYPPGALPVFALPALLSEEHYRGWFETLMWLCGAAAVASVTAILASLRASSARLFGAVAFAGLAPLALGSVLLTRFDLWPAALVAGALAALVAGRTPLAFALLGAAVAAKLYPLALLPLALVYASRAHGRRRAAVGLSVFVAVAAAAFLPFAVLAPDGLADSFERQGSRPLQIESLGAAVLLAAHALGAYAATVVSSFGSQNLAGALPDGIAAVQTGLAALAVVGVWILFSRGPAGREHLLVASAAALAGLVAFGKVLSPQFLVWLLPLVPLAAGRAGLAAGALFAAALVVTQLWFPFRYWQVVALESPLWLVLVRDLLLVALFVLLAVATGRGSGARYSSSPARPLHTR